MLLFENLCYGTTFVCFLIVFLIVLPGREHNPKAEYIFCCRGELTVPQQSLKFANHAVMAVKAMIGRHGCQGAE